MCFVEAMPLLKIYLWPDRSAENWMSPPFKLSGMYINGQVNNKINFGGEFRTCLILIKMKIDSKQNFNVCLNF